MFVWLAFACVPVLIASFCHVAVHAQGHSQDAHDTRGMSACLPSPALCILARLALPPHYYIFGCMSVSQLLDNRDKRKTKKKKLVKSDASLPGRAGSGPRNNNHEHARAHVGDLFLAFRVRVVVGRRRSCYEMRLGSLGSAGVPGDMALDAQKQIGRDRESLHAFGTNPRSWREDKLVSYQKRRFKMFVC